jgi:hypothetical protein
MSQEEALGHYPEVAEEYGEEEAVAVVAGMLSCTIENARRRCLAVAKLLRSRKFVSYT